MKFWLIPILSVVFALSIFVTSSVAKDRGFFGNVKRMLFPPEDLYELITKTELDITKTEAATSSKFQIKYDGPYSFGILLENLSTADYSRTKPNPPVNLKLKLEFYENNQPIFTAESIAIKFSPFFGLRGNGLFLGSFETPEQIPLMKEIECKATVIVPDKALQNKYGPVWFYIKKHSEK